MDAEKCRIASTIAQSLKVKKEASKQIKALPSQQARRMNQSEVQRDEEHNDIDTRMKRNFEWSGGGNEQEGGGGMMALLPIERHVTSARARARTLSGTGTISIPIPGTGTTPTH